MKKILIISFTLLFLACTKQAPVSSDIVTIDTSYYNKIKTDNRGKVLVVNVFASWCPPCEEETPDFVRFYADKDDNFELVGLSIDESLSDLQTFVDKHQINYPVFRIESDIQRQLRANKVPTTVIYKPDGTVYTTALGLLTEAKLSELIRDAGL
jgi:thiol-disulfide isomerase/thioredoxin